MRVCTFDVENLCSRPVVFNMRDQKKAGLSMKGIAEAAVLGDCYIRTLTQFWEN